MRLMYDACDPNGIPRGATMVGGYVDAGCRWTPGAWGMFPNAVKVRIASLPSTNDGVVGDGPPDNGTWPQWVAWVVMRRHAGVDPTMYTDADQWSTGQGAFRAAGVAEPHWWVANWNNTATVPPGAVAHQYADKGDVYDLSAVLDYWPGVDPAPSNAPVPPPAPAPDLSTLEDPVIILGVSPDPANPTVNQGIWLLSGGLYVHIPDPSDVIALTSQGVKQASIDFQFHQNLLAGAAALHGTLSGQLGVSGNLNVS